MKVLMLNTVDLSGGAARAALRLHRGLASVGWQSEVLVQSKSGAEPGVLGPARMLGRMLAIPRPHLDALPLRRYPERQRIIFSPAVVPDSLAARIEARVPDLINLHWICDGFLRLESLAKFRAPIVWTLHDSWPFTGGCHVPFECTRYRDRCGACPTLGSPRDNDLSRSILKRKLKAWKDIDLTIVTPSRWLASCAAASSVFRDRRIEVIPNGVDLTAYRPVDRGFAREMLGLPRDKKVILFGGVNIDSDDNKGASLLLGALQQLAGGSLRNEAVLAVFGASAAGALADVGFETRCLGRLNDDISLCLAYCAADVFVLPSIQENLPNMVVEAMACGTPCVAFDQGGLPDLIAHEGTGYLAKPFETEDLGKGIAWVLADDLRRQAMSRNSRRKAEEHFSLEKMASRYAALYEEVLKR